MTIFAAILAALLFPVSQASAQTFSLSVTYSATESSRDSHTTTEQFSLNGNTLQYKVSYTGYRPAGQKAGEKTCFIADDQLTRLKNILKEKRLETNESLLDRSSTNRNYSISLTILLSEGTKTYSIKANGSPGFLDGKPVYENSYFLFAFLKSLSDNCK